MNSTPWPSPKGVREGPRESVQRATSTNAASVAASWLNCVALRKRTKPRNRQICPTWGLAIKPFAAWVAACWAPYTKLETGPWTPPWRSRWLARNASRAARPRPALRRAVAAHRRVAHPGVCQLYDLDRAEAGFLITEDVAAGTNLALLTAAETLSVREVVSVAVSICDALAAIHRANLVHGDLKPTNVLLDPGGNATLTDVGLAIASDSDDIIAALQERSPEQRAGEPPDRAF